MTTAGDSRLRLANTVRFLCRENNQRLTKAAVAIVEGFIFGRGNFLNIEAEPGMSGENIARIYGIKAR